MSLYMVIVRDGNDLRYRLVGKEDIFQKYIKEEGGIREKGCKQEFCQRVGFNIIEVQEVIEKLINVFVLFRVGFRIWQR